MLIIIGYRQRGSISSSPHDAFVVTTYRRPKLALDCHLPGDLYSLSAGESGVRGARTDVLPRSARGPSPQVI